MNSILEFQDSIQRDLAWRKREISDFRVLAGESQDNSWHVFRSGQVLLCAHWEGFLKKSASLFIEYVFSLGLSMRDVSPNVVAIAFYGDIKKAAEAAYPGSKNNFLALANKILESADRKINKPTWSVDTEGNPGTDVLERVLNSIGADLCLGMDVANWSTMKVFINEQIVRDRHRVAHGEGHRISKVAFMEKTDRLLILLDALERSIMLAAENEVFLSATVRSKGTK